MAEIDLSQITVIIGRKNVGKSVLIEHTMAGMERFVCFDPLNDHYIPDATPVISPQGLKDELESGTDKIIVRDEPLKQEKMKEYLEVVEECIQKGFLKNYYIVIDEFNFYSSAHNTLEVIKDIAQFYVSHNNLGLVLGLRQAKDVYTDIFTQYDNMAIFFYGDFEDSKLSDLELPHYLLELIHGRDVLMSDKEGLIISQEGISPEDVERYRIFREDDYEDEGLYVIEGLSKSEHNFIWLSVNENKPVIHDKVPLPRHMRGG